MTRKNNTFQEIWDKLKKCKRVAMTLHYGPDGDSLASCAAMKYVLERDFKTKVRLVSYHNLQENLIDFKFVNEIEFGKDISELDPKDFDAYLFLDGGASSFFSGKLREKYVPPKNVLKINIDHHNTNEGFADLTYFDPESPAACSVLLDLFKKVGVKIDKELAERLLLGVCTDSGFFIYDSNPAKAIADASYLIRCGADYIASAVRPVLYNQPLRLKKYFALLFDNLKVFQNIGYSSVTEKDVKRLKLNESEVRLGPNELQLIKEFDIIFTLTEMGDYIKGSLRSKKNIDVSLIAKELGGGGHKPAASFMLSKMPLEEAEKKVLDAIKKIGLHKYETEDNLGIN